MSRIFSRLRALAAVAALGAAPAACAHGAQAGAAETDAGAGGAGEDDASAVRVRIVSHNAGSVEVSLDTGVGRQQLVVLAPHGVSAFRIPLRRLDGSRRLRLAARQVGSARDSSRTSVAVSPGARVVWTIESNLAFSSIAVD